MIGGETSVRCSAAGCVDTAVARVNWRNPRIHPADRVKVWLACEAHRRQLADYLSSRGFPVLVTPADVATERVPDTAGDPA